MMKLNNTSSVSPLLICFLALSTLQCKKIDTNTPTADRTPSVTGERTLQRFFDVEGADPFMQAVAGKIFQEEKTKPFVEEFVSYAGFPIWNHHISLDHEQAEPGNLSRARRNNKKTSFVPLVLSGDSTVNAILRITVSERDTTFKVIYRWQYKKYGYARSESRNNAKKVALLFMGMESFVFRHDSYQINDTMLFKDEGAPEVIKIASFAKPVSNQRAEGIGITICYQYKCPPLASNEKAFLYCETCETYWIPTGGGGAPYPPGTPGDSGGGGGDGGGNWHDNPCAPLPGAREVAPECQDPPGWEPETGDRDENGYLLSRVRELIQILQHSPSALLPCDSLNIMPFEQYGSMWQQVAQFKPSQYVMDRIDSIRNVAPNWIVDNFNIQSLEDAYGGIVNCDFFPVRITQMPTGYTPESLLEYFRTNINSFIDPNLGMSFGPYRMLYFNDTAKYNAPYEGSVGSLWHLKLGALPGADGSVIESGYSRYNSAGYQSNYFTVSTMETPLDFEHPVAGNRRFGIYSDPDHPGEYVFYTMGVDRAWDWIFDWGNEPFGGFKRADGLWSSMQQGMIQFIQNNNGSATFYSSHNTIARPHWTDVEDYLKGDIDFMELKRRLGC